MQVRKQRKTPHQNLAIFKVTSEHKHQYSAVHAVSSPMIGTTRVIHNHSNARTDNHFFNRTALLAFVQRKHG